MLVPCEVTQWVDKHLDQMILHRSIELIKKTIKANSIISCQSLGGEITGLKAKA